MSDIDETPTIPEREHCAGCSAWRKTGEHSESCLYVLIATYGPRDGQGARR